MPVSHSPALVAISIAKIHYSHKLIRDSGEFMINVPTVDILEKVHYCGGVSGRNVDKFADKGLREYPFKASPPKLLETNFIA